MSIEIKKLLENVNVLPVLEVQDIKHAAPLAKALYKGGITVAELTLRTSCALKAIEEMKQAVPEMCVGMGTIIVPKDVEKSIHAGADFLVSPGTTIALLKELKDAAHPSLPGVATVSGAMTAAEEGFQHLKFFPAEPAGGTAYLKSLCGPLPNIRFCPTGSINIGQVTTYLELPNVMCVGGSWVASKSLIAEEAWGIIEQNARLASEVK